MIAGRADGGAFIQVITQTGSYRADYPLSAYRKGERLRIGDSAFAPDGVSLSVRGEGLSLDGALRYGRLTPLRGDIMGPFRLLPMQCRHTVVSMEHTLTGSLCLNGKELDFGGGKGYIEGDAGRSFPKSYTWVQCSDFAQNCSIMASAALIPFGPCRFWGCICAVWLGGTEYRLATYHGAKIQRRDETRLVLTQGDLTLRVEFLQPHSGHTLAAPVRGKMARSIREAPAAPADFEFRQGDRILLRAKSQFASYEHVV